MLNMAGDGSRVRVGLRRSSNGRGIAPTTMVPTASDAHVMGFSDLRVNRPLNFRLDPHAVAIQAGTAVTLLGAAESQ